MKIATLTFHRALNYGAILQCYSLQKTIKDLGYESEVLDYDCRMISKDYKLLSTDSLPKFIKSLLFLPVFYRKKQNYNRFIKRFISVSKEVSYNELANVSSDYAAFITGSDQVWNYKLTGSDSKYFLDFVPEQKKRLSYAASFGIREIPKHLMKFYQRYINGMGHISVREQTAAELVGNICGRKAEVVLDPVFLQRAEDWQRLMSENTEKNYIFVYMPGKNTLKAARLLARTKKLKIIYCAYGYSLRNMRENIGDMRLSLGPDEFLTLLNGADYVLTGSFHATAFSLIFHKEFFVEVPENVGSRITDLLNIFGLEKRILNSELLPENCSTDWLKVSEKMDKLRKSSLMSLQKSIEAAVYD